MSIPDIPFVCGHPRSGTSLLTAIIDRHSQISMMPETHLLDGLRDEPPAKSHARLLIAAWDRLQARLGDLHFSPDTILQRFENYPCSDTGLLRCLLELWALRAGKPVAGEKTPAHLAFVDRILDAIPRSRAVLLVRDGRAVVEAMRRTAMHADTPLDHLIEGWVRAVVRCERWLAQYPDRACLIRFEDLVAQPEQTLSVLMEWLGAKLEPAMLEPGPTGTFRRWEEYAKSHVVRPIMPEKGQAWRSGIALLSTSQLDRLAPFLARLGYPEPGGTSSNASAPSPPLSQPPPAATAQPGASPAPEADLPFILLIGASRAGTASLASWLSLHPAVSPTPLRRRASLVLDWPLGREEFLQGLRSAQPDHARTAAALCHAASYYLAHPDLPRRVQSLVPEARIIVLLRDPVARAFSHWLRSWRIGVERLPFDEAALAEPSRVGGADALAAQDESFATFAHVHYTYALQGRYATHLTRWREALPAEQLLILNLDDLRRDADGVWKRACLHVGLSPTRTPPVPLLGAFTWPLTAGAVQRSAGAQVIRSALRGERSRLAEMLAGDLPWVD